MDPRTPASPSPAAGTARQLLALAAWLALTFAAAAVGAIASMDSADFYRQLQRPPWAPPASLFGPVWTVLYLMMGVAAWRAWREQPRAAGLALYIFQLVLNALWTWLFFAWHQGGLALLEIVVLWLAIALTARLFWRIDRAAGLLLLPYLAWVGYATALTYSLWRLNPGLLA